MAKWRGQVVRPEGQMSEEQKVQPLNLVQGDDEYIRLNYVFCPASVTDMTVSRQLVRDANQPNIGYIDHNLSNGAHVRFRGDWKHHDESFKECIFLFTDDEVMLIPLSDSLLKLKKVDV